MINTSKIFTYGHILSSAKATLGANSCVSFSHVRRSGNNVLHNLTKHIKHVRGLSAWTEDVSPHLMSSFSTKKKKKFH